MADATMFPICRTVPEMSLWPTDLDFSTIIDGVLECGRCAQLHEIQSDLTNRESEQARRRAALDGISQA